MSASITIDPSTLTFDEIDEFETISGRSLDELGDAGPKGKMFKALAYLAMKRQDPTFTIEQAGALTIADLDLDGASEAVNPTAAGE